MRRTCQDRSNTRIKVAFVETKRTTCKYERTAFKRTVAKLVIVNYQTLYSKMSTFDLNVIWSAMILWLRLVYRKQMTTGP